MDKERIKAETRSFIKGCEEHGRKLTFCALIPEMPYSEETTYILQVAADWFQGLANYEIFDILTPVLFETTTVEFRENIYRTALYKPNGNLHCYFEDLILLNEINYNPVLAAARQLAYA